MSLVKEEKITQLFNLLNESKLDYILQRNINNELPSHLIFEKDIDFLIHKEDKDKVVRFFVANGFKAVVHPFSESVFLYGLDKFKFLYHNKNRFHLDLAFQLAVKSLDDGQWIPLHQDIQASAWKNRRFNNTANGFGYWSLSYEDEFTMLVARSIFDKREFAAGYVKRINELIKLIDLIAVEASFDKIFFKYTDSLLEQITKGDFQDIIDNYLCFKDY